MNKIITLFIALFFGTQLFAQDSKGYVGLSLGVSIPSADTGETLESGLELGLINLGFRFSETFGATLNWGASGHNTDGGLVTVGVGYLSFGPMISAGGFDFKPQYAIVSTVFESFGEELTIDCTGFVLGGTYNIPLSSNWALAANADYLSFKPTDEEQENLGLGDESDNMFKLSMGIRYLF